MICHYITKTKVTKEASFKGKDKKNESAMNSQNENENEKDCASVKQLKRPKKGKNKSQRI